jgi:hypothetical protein
MIDETKESILENLKEKLSSPFYGTFLFSWLIWNWKIWYITLFVDSNLLMQSTNLLKIDYVRSIYRTDSISEVIFSIGHFLIFPFLSALVLIYLMPIVTCKFYEKSLETKNNNKIAKNKKDKEFLESIGEKLEVEKNILIKQAEVKKEKNKSEKTQDEIWREEYNQFKRINPFQSFSYIVDSIYKYSGRIETMNGFKVPQEILVYAHTNDLISYDKLRSRIELTEKGKFFVKQFSL